MFTRSRRPWRLVLPGASLLVCACHTWRVQPIALEALLAAPSAPSSVRLTLQDSSRVVLRQPRLLGDSVSGILGGSQKGTARTLPLDGIIDVAVRRFSPERTMGLAAAGAAGLFVVVAVGCELSECAGVDFGNPAAGP